MVEDPGGASVIITTHNRADLLHGAVSSALAADGVGEVIVVDDASTDSTDEVLGRFGDAIVRVEGSFGTPGRARNAGVEVAAGGVISFLDSDDEMHASKVTCCTPPLRDPEVGLVHGGIEVLDESGDVKERQTRLMARAISHAASRGTSYAALASSCMMFTSATVIRRSAFEGVGGYDTDAALVTNEDLDLYLRLSRAWKLVYVGCAAARYRIWAGNHDRNSHALGQVAVARKHLRELDRCVTEDPSSASRYGLLRRQAISFRTLGDEDSAWTSVKAGARCQPLRFAADPGFLRIAVGCVLARARRP